MSRRRSKVFLKKNKKKSLVTQQDLNSRLVSVNFTLMQQMENQQQRDTETTLERQRRQGEILRDLMRD